MKCTVNKKGFGLVDVVLASAIAATSLMFLGQGLFGVWKIQMQIADHKERELELTRAIQDVLRVGRTAQWCLRVVEPGSPVYWLECTVDRNSPPTIDASDDSRFRFGLSPNGFEWQEFSGGKFNSIMTYDYVSYFEICDDDRMRSTDDPCPTEDTAVTRQHLRNIAAATFPTESDRFFRIRMGVSHEIDGAIQTRFLQSAFYVRHPNPEGVLYGWGQWND